MKRRFFLGYLTIACAVGSEARAESASPFTVALGSGVTSRHFAWRDDRFGDLRSYDLAAAPLLRGEATVFPGALVGDGIASTFGLALRGERMFLTSSERTHHDDVLPTRSWSYSALVRARFVSPVGSAWFDGGFAERAFSLDSAGITAPAFPSVRYRGPEIGCGATVALPGRFELSPRDAISPWSSLGEIGESAWFPRSRGVGVEAGLRVSRPWTDGVRAEIDLTWSRDVIALRPEPGDPHIAGGASDDRLTLAASVAWSRSAPRPLNPAGNLRTSRSAALAEEP